MSEAKRKNLKVESVAFQNKNVFLMPLDSAFAAGNYWQVRKLILSIQKDAQASEKDKAHALSIWERIRTDPVVIAISIVGIIFFIIASWITVN